MSSGFVSGGTIEQPIERDAEWLQAQQALEQSRQNKAQLEEKNAGKTLYEVLQQNKAAKQEAWEEAARLKHQFQSLDEDDVEFLDSVLESTRAREAATRKETAEQLEAFRRQQDDADVLAETADADAPAGKELAGAGEAVDVIAWQPVAKKRKRAKDSETRKVPKLARAVSSEHRTDSGRQTGKGQKLDKAEKNGKDAVTEKLSDDTQSATVKTKPPTDKTSPEKATNAKAAGLGLAAYASDSD